MFQTPHYKTLINAHFCFTLPIISRQRKVTVDSHIPLRTVLLSLTATCADVGGFEGHAYQMLEQSSCCPTKGMLLTYDNNWIAWRLDNHILRLQLSESNVHYYQEHVKPTIGRHASYAPVITHHLIMHLIMLRLCLTNCILWWCS